MQREGQTRRVREREHPCLFLHHPAQPRDLQTIREPRHSLAKSQQLQDPPAARGAGES